MRFFLSGHAPTGCTVLSRNNTFFSFFDDCFCDEEGDECTSVGVSVGRVGSSAGGADGCEVVYISGCRDGESGFQDLRSSTHSGS